MLVGDVRQDGDVVRDRADPLEGQAVRRALHDGRAVTGIRHRPERGLQVRGIGGRGVGLVRFLAATDPDRGRADHPGPHAGRLERRDREERGRRLAVRAGDPDDRQLVARVPVPPGRRGGQRRWRPLDDELGQADVRHGPLHDRGGGAGRRGRLDVVVPVHVQPGDGHEERARVHGSRIVSHALDAHVRQAVRADRPAIPPSPAQAPFRCQAVDERGEGGGLRGFRRAQHRPDGRAGGRFVVGHRWTSRATRAVRRPAA